MARAMLTPAPLLLRHAIAPKAAALTQVKREVRNIFTAYKPLFYTLRIIREIVPGFSVSISVLALIIAIVKVPIGDSYTHAAILPVKSVGVCMRTSNPRELG